MFLMYLPDTVVCIHLQTRGAFSSFWSRKFSFFIIVVENITREWHIILTQIFIFFWQL